MTGLKTNLETKQTDNSVFDKKPVQPATNQLQTDIYKHINTSIGKKSVLPIPTIGEWVPGNRYDQTWAFFQEGHICCGENVTKMHFEFLSDIKNSESALSEFVSKTKGKTIVIFGDSIQKNFYLGLVDVLKLGKFWTSLQTDECLTDWAEMGRQVSNAESFEDAFFAIMK